MCALIYTIIKSLNVSYKFSYTYYIPLIIFNILICSGINESKHYRGLGLQALTEIRVLIAFSKNAHIINGKLNAMDDAIENIKPTVKKEVKKKNFNCISSIGQIDWSGRN